MNIRPQMPTTPALSPDDNYTSETGAYRIAAKIREFWGLRGLFPNVWVSKTLSTQSPTDAERTVFVVRSNMIAGRPQ